MVDSKLLAELIAFEVRKDFAAKHISGNLANSMKIQTNFGKTVNLKGRWKNIISTSESYSLLIDPQEYSFYKYFKTGSIVPMGSGYSYASEVDRKGGFRPIRKGAKAHKRGRKAYRGGMEGVFTDNHTGYVSRSIEKGIKRFTASIGENIEIKYY